METRTRMSVGTAKSGFRNTLVLFLLIGTIAVFAKPSLGQTPPSGPSVTIVGEVQRAWFKDPGVRYLVAVSGTALDDEVWDVRGSSASQLAQLGWSSSTVQIGDSVTVTGIQEDAQLRRLTLISITLADGTVLTDSASE